MNERQLSDDAVEKLLRIAGPRPPVPPERAARAKANVREAWAAGVRRRRFQRRALWSAPLAAAAMFAIIFLLIPRPRFVPVASPPIATVERVIGSASVALGERVPLHAAVTTSDGARAALRLADGTSMRIDRSSHVRFDAPRRFVLDRGAIYIATVHTGVEVVTPFGVVRDVGTAFEVRVGSDSARLRVRDGEVVVGSHRAGKGEQLDVSARGVSASRVPTWGSEWEWASSVAPALALDGKRVTAFLAWVSGEGGVEVRFDSPITARKAAATTLHGSINGVPPLAAAEAVLPTAGMRATFDRGVLTVSAQ